MERIKRMPESLNRLETTDLLSPFVRFVPFVVQQNIKGTSPAIHPAEFDHEWNESNEYLNH